MVQRIDIDLCPVLIQKDFDIINDLSDSHIAILGLSPSIIIGIRITT